MKKFVIQVKAAEKEIPSLVSEPNNWIGNFSKGKGINEGKVKGKQSGEEFLKPEEEEKVEMSGLKIVRMLSRLVLPSVTTIFILGYVGMAFIIYNDVFL